MPEDTGLLPPETLARLEGYRLTRRQAVYGEVGGSRRSRQKGGSIEFTDYREYTPGDDLRRVDWKAYARLRRVFVKEYLDDRRPGVLFLLDNSASMDSGEPLTKGVYAAQVLSGLVACALAGQERPLIATAADRGPSLFRPAGGRESLPGSLRFLQGVQFGGRANMYQSFTAALQSLSRIKSLYVFSDFYDLEDAGALLRLAAQKGVETTFLHTLAPEEWRPGGEGDWVLVDSETGERVEVSLTPMALAAYARKLREFISALETLCRRWGARRVALNSGEGAEATLFKTLPRAGVINPR